MDDNGNQEVMWANKVMRCVSRLDKANVTLLKIKKKAHEKGCTLSYVGMAVIDFTFLTEAMGLYALAKPVEFEELTGCSSEKIEELDIIRAIEEYAAEVERFETDPTAVNRTAPSVRAIADSWRREVEKLPAVVEYRKCMRAMKRDESAATRFQEEDVGGGEAMQI